MSTSQTPSSEQPLASVAEMIASREFARLAAILDPDIELKALTPGGFREAAGTENAIAWFVDWFGGGYAQQVVLNEAFSIGTAVGVRFRLRRQLGESASTATWHLIEQHWFAEAGPNGIERISLVCSGNSPEHWPAAGEVHEFDAGNLGCGDGLPQELMRRIRAVQVGDVLRVITRDPSAREDLPSLARMNGHHASPPESIGDGRTLFLIERRK